MYGFFLKTLWPPCISVELIHNKYCTRIVCAKFGGEKGCGSWRVAMKLDKENYVGVLIHFNKKISPKYLFLNVFT